jgi:transcriptional regulator with PAS, ATPase and Fis domain
MSYNLKKISNTLNQFAIILSQVLHVDVEIADVDLFRVAGSGKLKKKVNQSMKDEGHAYSVALQTSKPQIILNPREDEVCQSCNKRLTCKETFEISYPIMVKSEVIGVIGFVCYTKQQRIRIMKNLNEYCVFLEKISKFIALDISDAIEYENQILVVNVLNTVLNEINFGILVLNSDSKINMFNHKANKLLGIATDNATKNIKIQPVLHDKKISNEYIITVNKDIYHVIGTKYDTGIKEFETILFIYESRIITSTNNVKGAQILGVNRLIGNSLPINNLKSSIHEMAYFKSNVILHGEVGTEVRDVVLAIYEESTLSKKQFFEFNCASFTEQDIEKALFGSMEDNKASIGILEKASKHTLWLKNIDALPLHVQTKLVDLLETEIIYKQKFKIKEVTPARFISSTEKDIISLVEEGLFRQDLYYLLAVHSIAIPPLRERSLDIIKLAKLFLKRHLKVIPNVKFELTSDFQNAITLYSWPGNILQLNNVMEKVAIKVLDSSIIDKTSLPFEIREGIEDVYAENKSIENHERELIEKSLNQYGTSVKAKQQVAKELGISIATLYRKIRYYKLIK